MRCIISLFNYPSRLICKVQDDLIKTKGAAKKTVLSPNLGQKMIV